MPSSVATTILVPAPMKGGTWIFMPFSSTAVLYARRRGAAAHHGIGFRHFEGDVLRQRDAERAAFIHLHQRLHAVLQELRLLAHELGVEFDLVVGLHVLEGQRVAGGEEELKSFFSR